MQIDFCHSLIGVHHKVSSLGSAARILDWRIFTTWILHAAQSWLNKK